MSLSHLVSGGNSILTADAVQYLNRIGIRSVEDLLFSDPKSFLDQIKISPETFSILIENIKQQYAPVPWNALDLYQNSYDNTVILSTGCDSIDNLLGGGIISGDLIELVGEPSSGKSQLCISTAVHTVTSTSYSLLYIDTSNSFTTERAQEILSYHFHNTHGKQFQSDEEYLEAYEKAKEAAFSRIYVHRIHDIFSLFSLLETLNTSFEQKSAENIYKHLRLVIIDSLGVLLGSVLAGGKGSGPQQSNFGMSMMTSVSRMMKHIATEYYISFLFTNYTVRGSDRDNRKKPGLGYTWSFVPPIQLYFSEENTLQGATRVMTVTKSTRKVYMVGINCDCKAIGSQVYFDITEEGLVEIK